MPRTHRCFMEGTVHQAWSRTPRVKGARKLGTIRAVQNAFYEPLQMITRAGVIAEGFPGMTVDEFIEFFLQEANRGYKGFFPLTADFPISVARFEYL